MHVLTHSELRPYKCNICSNHQFHRRDKWLKHMSKEHPGEKIDMKSIEIPNVLLNKNDSS
jgi:hypothetical protein